MSGSRRRVRTRRAGRLKAEEAGLFDGGYLLGARAVEVGLIIDRFGDVDALVRELGGKRARAETSPAAACLGLLGRLPRLAAEALVDVAEERMWPRV